MDKKIALDYNHISDLKHLLWELEITLHKEGYTGLSDYVRGVITMIDNAILEDDSEDNIRIG